MSTGLYRQGVNHSLIIAFTPEDDLTDADRLKNTFDPTIWEATMSVHM